MRTVTFQSVYDAILQRHGLDPVGDAVTQNTARAITEHITERVRTGWNYWPFPELTRTEERAYRTVWNDSRQFNVDDELFFIPSMGYYKVVSNPPIGTPPATQNPTTGAWTTNTTYYEVLDPVDTYVEYDQPCKKPIDRVLGIYSQNPRVKTTDPYGNGICLCYRPSEKGIDVLNAPGPTVFVQYMMPPSVFTMKPYIDGKSYNRSNRVFHPPTGNCYRSLADNNTSDPTNTSYWTVEPFPSILAPYAKAGAYCDCLRETLTLPDQETRVMRATAASAEAEQYIDAEIDKLMAQRHLFYWMHPCRYPSGICVTQPWTGGSVSELTDECETDWTFPPPPTPTGKVVWEYHEEIASLVDLAALSTLDKLVGSKIEITINGAGQEYRLLSGQADAADPGQVVPNDWNLATNNKHWQRQD